NSILSLVGVCLNVAWLLPGESCCLLFDRRLPGKINKLWIPACAAMTLTRVPLSRMLTYGNATVAQQCFLGGLAATEIDKQGHGVFRAALAENFIEEFTARGRVHHAFFFK